jgi:phage gpG-like protein
MSDFLKYKTRIENALDTIATKIGNEAVNQFQRNFEQQGFNGEKWKEVQRRTPGTNAYKYPKRGRAKRTRGILIQTGTLLRSIRVIRKTSDSVTIGFIDYGKYHNEGMKPQPKRQFAGIDNDLSLAIKTIVTQEIKKALAP